ncbi:MAG: phosphohistidine phosphatase SixA [Akkermansiaceae bacterium]|nr:phosphohistidine phosphatase SixA [Akkermansiaceae bacterium]
MELLLIRHAKAENVAENAAASDAERALTKSGRKQAAKVGLFLKRNELVPDVVLASPLVRARQTAEIISDNAVAPRPIIEPWLACGMRAEVALNELSAYDQFQRVALVGHNPDFEYLASWLLGSQCGGIHVGKATMIHFSRVSPPSQGACLELMLPVSVE